MKADATFAEESATIPEIIHANSNPNDGEPRERPPRTTFEPLDNIELPIDDEALQPDDPQDYSDFPRPDAMPLGEHGSVFVPVDSTAIQGGKGPLVEVLAEELGIDVDGALEAYAERGTAEISAATAQFGTDALGTYLPYHYYGLSKRTPWGIYLFLEPLLAWSLSIAKRAKFYRVPLSPAEAVSVAFYATFRHELFHFHVERFAVREEVIQRRPIYVRYDQNVFSRTPPGADWLEECLAQACVIESRLVAKRVGLTPTNLRLILHYEFKDFGPGYRDFDCGAHGGPEAAHKLLGAQIATASKSPGYSLTEFATPKRGYQESSATVPAFLVFRPWFVSRFQLAMPKAHQWPKFAKLNGFVDTKRRKGDHEVWAHGKQHVHINFVRGDLDIASAKDVAKILNVSVRVVLEAIRQARKVEECPTPELALL